MANEVTWGWEEIAVMLMWRLAPNGLKLLRSDLGALPMDLVLFEDRRETELVLSWIPIEKAADLIRTQQLLGMPEHERTTVTQLGGRWQKIAVVLAWKLARDGITLTRGDRDAVPADKQLLAEGHADCVEYRFLPHAEAAAIAKKEREGSGLIILERGRG